MTNVWKKNRIFTAEFSHFLVAIFCFFEQNCFSQKHIFLQTFLFEKWLNSAVIVFFDFLWPAPKKRSSQNFAPTAGSKHWGTERRRPPNPQSPPKKSATWWETSGNKNNRETPLASQRKITLLINSLFLKRWWQPVKETSLLDGARVIENWTTMFRIVNEKVRKDQIVWNCRMLSQYFLLCEKDERESSLFQSKTKSYFWGCCVGWLTHKNQLYGHMPHDILVIEVQKT